jgi:predicted permease
MRGIAHHHMINLRLAFRALFRAPVVTIVAIASLALGIGANAAIFSLFERTVLRVLPVQAPDRLVNLGAPGPKPGSNSCGNEGSCDEIFSYPMFRDLERAQTVFTGLSAHCLFGANLSFGGQTLSGQGVLVSGSYFPVLGVQPALGRLLSTRDDETVGESHVVVLSHAYWRTRLSASPGVLNQTMNVNGQAMTIVGVTPRSFSGTTTGEQPQVFVPITMRGFMQPGFKGFDDRRSYWVYLFARLKPGVSIERARTALNVPYHALLNEVDAPLQQGLSDQTMARFRAKTITIDTGAHGQSAFSVRAKAPLALLFGVTAFVLLIACANVANLLLARAAARTGEFAVRLSLGASRGHLIAQLLTESCLVAMFGGATGLLVARWTLDVMAIMASIEPADASNTIDPQLELPVLFAAALALGTGLLFGLFPALHSTRLDLVSALKGHAGQPSGARAARRFRTTLATTQIALSMALLISAGLFTKSLLNLSRVDLGMKIDHVITFGVSPELNGYKPQASQALFERLESELAALPGVTAVTASGVALLADDTWGHGVSVEGFTAGPDTDTNSSYNEVGPGYFRTLGVPLMAGREFTRADVAGAPKVAIVNEAFAKKFSLGRNAIGKRLGNRGKVPDVDIVGLVQNAKYSEVKGEVPPVFFQPYRQSNEIGAINFYVRSSLDGERLLAAVPKVLALVDTNLPIEHLRTMRQQVRENVSLDRHVSVLLTAFACLATLLAGIGVYGVLAYTVSQRTREIGLRIALGAAPGRVRNMILRQVGTMTVIGGTIGLFTAVGFSRLAQSMLYELRGTDPVVLVASAVALTCVAAAAGFVPAYRASRVDPMQALRYE